MNDPKGKYKKPVIHNSGYYIKMLKVMKLWNNEDCLTSMNIPLLLSISMTKTQAPKISAAFLRGQCVHAI